MSTEEMQGFRDGCLQHAADARAEGCGKMEHIYLECAADAEIWIAEKENT